LALAGGLALALAPAARAQDRSAQQILKDIDDVKMPTFDPAMRNDRAALTKFITAQREALVKKAELAGELYKKDPKNPALAKLLPERWQTLTMMNKSDQIKPELDDVVAHSQDAGLKAEATFWKAVPIFRSPDVDADKARKVTEEFIKVAPKDERGAQLLQALASQTPDSAEQARLYKRIVKDYPDSQTAKMVEGNLKRLESVGKPFNIDFTDAVKGTEVSMKSLKGKVVVIDFWATWCGPCVAEMPNMKKLYAEYKDKGVEFIGVSLDAPKEEGGLDALKKFVAENHITWPQYYQGKGWEGEFSRSWGINAIPAVFIVDADGKLYSVEARGKLDTLIPELLKKAKTKTDAGAGGQN
jgi:thiol-disulfide isomerase/thioredoxin